MNLVLGKLADSVMQEALLLYGVRDKVEWVKRELAWIQSFLVDLDAKRNKDERVKRWVSEVKEVAYWIEDTLDQFMVEVEQEGEVDGGSHSQSQKGLRKKLKKIGKKAIEPIAKHKIGSEMSKIQERIREISTSRINYGITDLKDCSGGSARHARRIVIPEIDETEVIGFGDHKNKIVSRLIDTNISRRSVVSIVGTGGLGKTTLAAKIYKRYNMYLLLT